MPQPEFRAIVNQNQLSAMRTVMGLANWQAEFDLGNPRGDRREGEELYKGKLHGSHEGEIFALRSQDMIDIIAEGRFDIAAIGSDVVEEFYNNRFIELARLGVGRKWPPQSTRLELTALVTSTVDNPENIPKGAIVMTERAKITQGYLEQFGHKVIVKDPYEDMLDFREKVEQSDTIGIRLILGTGTVQLEPHAPDSYLLAMVNEEGSTIQDYNLKVISKIRDIDTLLITTERSMTNDKTREAVFQFARDIGESFPGKIESEYSGSKERY